MMGRNGLVLAMMLAVTPLAAQEEMDMDADRDVTGGGVLPAGFEARTDEDAPMDNIRFEIKDGMYDISVGPAFVFYKPGDVATGTYTISSTVTQTSSKGHAHGAGLIFGGADILGEGQVYTYFLVRGDGNYLVKTRTGEETANISPRWEVNAAIDTDTEDGEATNVVSVEVGTENVIFLVNGTEVYRALTADLYTDGNYGLRLNHNLDMIISPVELHGGM